MKIPSRCNKRICQARRNLSKRPQYYKTWPNCHVSGCDGKMYVDNYRLKKGAHDGAPVCTDDACQYMVNRVKAGKAFFPRHRVSTKGCIGYEDYKIKQALKASKHCPHKTGGEEDAPF